tara:strand:+ start:672 stop:890 length:219 start_codon:yes stop_codon:yes gene_type:complete
MKMKVLDLHGARHYEVDTICHNFINDNWGLEMKIITGNSHMMKHIVAKILEFYKLEFTLDNPYNMGYIIVRK